MKSQGKQLSWSVMNETLDFLVRHGAAVLFVVVFIEQLGLPLPAAPWLVAAGALAGAGKVNWLGALLSAAVGSILADMIWFYVGRHYGNKVLNLLCRISLEPDSCVRRTKNVFTQYGMKGVVVAKFIPGLSTLAPPLAGSSGASASRFLLFDGTGSLLYGGAFILVGTLFSQQLEQVLRAFASLGGSALGALGGLCALYIVFKFFQRNRLLRELRMSRITVDELRKIQEAGENPMILDVRPQAELDEDPLMIVGAMHMSMDEVEQRQHEIPRDRDIILYCSCPNEVSSAKIALTFRRRGIQRVRPLLGGFDAWRKQNYPTAPRAPRIANPSFDTGTIILGGSPD